MPDIFPLCSQYHHQAAITWLVAPLTCYGLGYVVLTARSNRAQLPEAQLHQSCSGQIQRDIPLKIPCPHHQSQQLLLCCCKYLDCLHLCDLAHLQRRLVHQLGSGDWSLLLLRPGALGRALLCSSCLLLLFSAANQLSAGRGACSHLLCMQSHVITQPPGPLA